MFLFRRHLAALTAALALACIAAPTQAQPKPGAELKIGFSYSPTTLDPHVDATTGNISISSHFFETLVQVDPGGRYVPGLAVGWRAIEPTTWEIRLRKDVKFHDGSDFSAEDVQFSIERPAKLPKSALLSYTKSISGIQIVDAHTLRLKTAEPYGPLPGDLSSVPIVSRKAAASAGADAFDSGKAMVGTGPFVFAEYKKGDHLSMTRFAGHWATDKPAWEKVTFSFIPDEPARANALLAGEVDLIDAVPAPFLPKIRGDSRLQVRQRTTWRTIFFEMNYALPDSSPMFTNAGGQPLGKNPLKDPRVREALSKGTDRRALVRTALDGFALPASQIVAPGIVGFDTGLGVDTYDLEGAKKLLAEAGYPQGFGVVLATPTNRYINDEQVGQALAAQWAQVGVKARLSQMPVPGYWDKMKAGEFGIAMLGWGTMGADYILRPVLGTPDPAKGFGGWNWGKYSNRKMDELVQAALGSTDPAKREDNARNAMTLAMKDHAVLPTHYQLALWAMKKGIGYDGRIDEFTFAWLVKPE